MNQPVNPYVFAAPVRKEQGFLGRQDTIGWVARELESPSVSTLSLLGPRTIGKTSLLLQLERALSAGAFLPIYFDLQGQANRSLGQVLAGLAAALARKANLSSPGPNLFDDQGNFFRRTFLPRFYDVVLQDERRLIFLLDEFNAMDETTEAELPETAAGKALFPFLEGVMAEDRRSVFVFAVGRQAKDIALDLGPSVRGVGALNWDSAEALVRRAEASGTLQFSALAISHLLNLTGAHPYLTQLLCHQVWAQAYAEIPPQVPLVDTVAIDSAISNALMVGNQRIAWAWNGLSLAEKVYAAAMAGMANEMGVVSEERVFREIVTHAAWLSMQEIEFAPRDLTKRQVLEETGTREHRFVAEIFRLWVQQHWSLLKIADESGEAMPPGEQSFVMGKDFFAKWQWESAIRCFREVLEVNPNHFHARLHLGEALLELGQVDDAVVELVQAHELNPDEAHLSLTRALTAQEQVPMASGERTVQTQQTAIEIQGLPLEEEKEAEPAPGAEILQWLRQVRETFSGADYVGVLRLLFPVIVVPIFSVAIFYGIGVSLARGMGNLTWLPTFFDASTFYRFGLVSAILGLFPGIRFSYEFIKYPALSLELVYLSLYRYAYPFLIVVLIYGALTLLAWVSQVSVSEEEWEGFQIFFGWLRRLFEE